MKRILLPWEINHLRKYGFDINNPDQIDSTPVEYITGHAQFRGLDFLVNPYCLIPRLETERIVDLALEFILSHPRPHWEIADVGCGTGALGIALVLELDKNKLNNLHLTLSDISKEALKITQENIDSLIPHLKDKVSVIESDLLESYPQDIKIDCLVSNLPYIPSPRIKTLDSSVKDHEPLLALDGGLSGTTLINKLLDQVTNKLNHDLVMIFEIDSIHKLSDFRIPQGFKTRIEIDEFGKPRYLIINN